MFFNFAHPEQSEESNMTDPFKIICVADYYLPGFKGGGPITTIANMRSILKDVVEIDVFTRSHDLGSSSNYGCVDSDKWNNIQGGKVYYASAGNFGYGGLRKAISESSSTYQLLYLNSFFGFRSSIEINYRFHRKYPLIPILIAPRGEFSDGALAIKSLKKRLFISVARVTKIYQHVKWHASTVHEKNDILKRFCVASNDIYIADDPISIESNFEKNRNYDVSPKGKLRLVFISRISQMKNLYGLLEYLQHTSSIIDLDIFGPIEDAVYWEKCQSQISVLPANIQAKYKGTLQPSEVSDTFSNYDLFVFPSRGENFGHVIFEALRAGTPVMVSDQTPWKQDVNGAVTVIPLIDFQAWVARLNIAAYRSQEEKLGLRYAARAYAEKFAAETAILEKNVSMFRTVLGEKSLRTGEPPMRGT